ncbi:protein of unknown function [Candidatus Nitrosocosmicus franklandus]|uniref:Uncharacterized protein n=1 Tax=Candidatus Nitrosocosmicus franklandianus TaxID=1798806 RepID=A0A484I6U4_9ARCH|nr:protein of unknown function [Candidatus Nitrosocosmicus franklandus]
MNLSILTVEKKSSSDFLLSHPNKIISSHNNTKETNEIMILYNSNIINGNLK